MASERAEPLPDELDEWLARQADSSEYSRDELLALAVDLYRFLEDCEGIAPDTDGEGISSLADRLEALDERVASLADDLEEQSEEFDAQAQDVDEKIENVRERVIQVKREADGKAPANHEHPDLSERINTAGETAVDARDRLDQVESEIDRIDRGFDNYEEVLDYLTEATDDLERKVDILGQVAVDLRQRLGEIEAQQSERQLAETIRTSANRHGISSAKCDGCGESVLLGLLSRPRCPHCDSPVADVSPASGFFGSPTLEVGSLPALEGDRQEEPPDSPDELFERDDDE